MGCLLLAFGSAEARAADYSKLNVSAAVSSLDVNASARPLGLTATTSATSSIAASLPATSVSASLAKSIDREAAWLYRGGWPLYALADRYANGAALSDEAKCIATAVYFEARGEPVEGQLAVARVIMNRASSGRYPASWCAVVKQPAQFSFVRRGAFPAVKTASTAWARAQGITRLAMANVVPSLSTDVLWYHANYVAPSWGRRLNMVQKIGAHIFYRS